MAFSVPTMPAMELMKSLNFSRLVFGGNVSGAVFVPPPTGARKAMGASPCSSSICFIVDEDACNERGLFAFPAGGRFTVRRKCRRGGQIDAASNRSPRRRVAFHSEMLIYLRSYYTTTSMRLRLFPRMLAIAERIFYCTDSAPRPHDPCLRCPNTW